MTISVDLTAAWQQVTSDASAFLTVDATTDVHIAFDPLEPTGDNYHTIGGSAILSYSYSKPLWARLDEADGNAGKIKIDSTTDPTTLGSGLDLLTIAPVIIVGGV